MSNINNSYNFFEIDKEGVTFWGLDISPVYILLDKKIKKLISQLNLPLNEVNEIYDDNTFEFFKKVYMKVN